MSVTGFLAVPEDCSVVHHSSSRVGVNINFPQVCLFETQFERHLFDKQQFIKWVTLLNLTIEEGVLKS